MFGKLDSTEINQLIARQLVGRIGCHADGITYVVPISYAYDGTDFYAYSGKGLKMDMMKKNPKVCFQLDDTRDLSNWQSVICWGEFEELTGKEERMYALHLLNNRVVPVLSSQTMHITPEWPFPLDKNETIDGIFFRIRAAEKTGRFEKSSAHYFFAT